MVEHTAWLVLLETSGNQRFVFATNRLAENVGASELIWRAGIRFVLDAVRPGLFSETPAQLTANLLDETRNPRLAAPIQESDAEVVIAASGKSLILTGSRQRAEGIVTAATTQALMEAPGLDLKGAIVGGIDLGRDDMDAALRRVHEELAAIRARLPGPETRFPQLPIVNVCRSSGLPANQLGGGKHDRGDERLRSVVSEGKRKASGAGLKRMQAALCEGRQYYFPYSSIDDVNWKWLAVVHADGNGVGQIFQSFGKAARAAAPGQWREYLDRLRRFSLALDFCGIEAVRCALDSVASDIGSSNGRAAEAPLIPLVLGGDDLTAVCDGRYALRFATEYLAAFEAETQKRDAAHLSGIIPDVAMAELGEGRLGACAGVAIVKPHYPFHVAYELSEQLLRSAKTVKQRVVKDGRPFPCSALDFHIHFDSSGGDLEEIRGRLQTADGQPAALIKRPYVVTQGGALAGATEPGRRWAAAHAWQLLQEAAQSVFESRTRGNPVPSSQLHVLRAALFMGRSAAEAELDLIRHRYQAAGLSDVLQLLAGGPAELAPSLFQEIDEEGGPVWTTGLLDLMDVLGVRE